MNKVILMGRLTRDPEIRYSQGPNATGVCRYSLAVNRSYKREGEPDADFINVVAFGNRGEFASKYFKKGMMVAVVGELRTGSYTDKDGNKRYTTDVIASEQHFAESRSSSEGRDQGADFADGGNNYSKGGSYNNSGKNQGASDGGFTPVDMNIEGDDDLPF
ncbi:MAG: single-stranded DNA-binding protein [Lachnospiraceae bacterium]|nr:single-stranded DNA-binding protein [Lachnospiraceae bacterium]